MKLYRDPCVSGDDDDASCVTIEHGYDFLEDCKVEWGGTR
jgi:hypothetical protein